MSEFYSFFKCFYDGWKNRYPVDSATHLSYNRPQERVFAVITPHSIGITFSVLFKNYWRILYVEIHESYAIIKVDNYMEIISVDLIFFKPIMHVSLYGKAILLLLCTGTHDEKK